MNFDLMGRKVVSVAKDFHVLEGAFAFECFGCSNQPQMKTNDPVIMLLDIYDYNILKIDSALSLTSFFDL